MKFGLGRMKLGMDSSVEEETINRWRLAATKGGVSSNVIPVTDYELEKPEWPLEELVVPAPPLSSLSSRAPQPLTNVVDISTRQTESASNYLSARNPGLSAEEDLRNRFGGRLRAAMGQGTVIQGRLTFDSPVRIDGMLTGEVFSTSTLVVGEHGVIDANIQVGSLIVFGRVIGPVEATDLVEIRRGGSIEGDIYTARIAIEEGGYLSGECKITKV